MLTEKPRIPVLVRVAALTSMTAAGPACADDSMDTFPVDPSATAGTTTHDVYPTAGACAHASNPEGCSTGPETTSGPDTDGATSTGNTDGSGSTADTGSESGEPTGPGSSSGSSGSTGS